MSSSALYVTCSSSVEIFQIVLFRVDKVGNVTVLFVFIAVVALLASVRTIRK